MAEYTALNFEYTGAVQSTTLTRGKYKLQVWGAQGGSYSSSYKGGYGGYSEGILTLNKETEVFIYVGGQSKTFTGSTASSGGFNGGGDGASSPDSHAQGGGGGTDIRIGTDSLYARVIVAGGGAGSSDTYNALKERYGGGLTAGAYSSAYQATQTSGYSFGKGQNGRKVGSSFSEKVIPGCGGGWYGGSNGTSEKYTSGGSGYVYTESTASNYPSGCLLNSSYYLTEAKTVRYTGTAEIPKTDGSGVELGHSGHGYAIITPLDSGSSASELQYYNGSSSIATNPYYYNGTEFVLCDAYYYDGTEFKKL